MRKLALNKLSIGLRLSLWYVLIFALAQLVFGAGMYAVLRHHLLEIVDDSLGAEMQDLRYFLQGQKQDADVDKIREEVVESYSQDHAGEYLQIVTAKGENVYLSSFLAKHSLPPVPATQERKAHYQDRTLGRKPFRFLSASIETHGQVFLVQLGTPTHEIHETLGSFLRYLLWLVPVVLLSAALGGNWLSHRALAPVDALTRTARTINVTNLSSRVERLETGDELQRLSDTLNEMLARIESAVLRITEFTADASHELRTPVALIRTEAEVALRHPRTDQEYRSALQHVLTESERMTQLLEQLLSLVRADSGRETLHMAEVDLGMLAREAVVGWQKVATAQGLRLLDSIPEQPVGVTGDSVALRRVFDILLDNAIKYSTSPGDIHLSVEEHPGRAVLKVRDAGTGIASEEHPKIFERFYRVDKARSRQMGGAGLGLAIAQWIVRQHQGTILVNSSPGEGAEFVVELPVAVAGPALRQTPLHAPVP
jgi:heavy metal sensor kinase